MPTAVRFLGLSLVLVLASSACASEAPLAGGACPCVTESYRCCPADQYCVPKGEMCAPVESTDEDHVAWALFMGFDACEGSYDAASDGTIDMTWTTERRPDAIEKLVDQGADGTIDSRVFASFNEARRPLEWRWVSDSYETLMSLTWAYDSMRPTQFDIVVPEGSPAALFFKTSSSTFSYDGPQAVMSFDKLADQRVDEREVFFQEGDRLVRVETDIADGSHFDGTVDRWMDISYGPHGVEQRRTASLDGVAWLTRYFRDGSGRVVRIESDEGGDGTIDSTLVKTWDHRDRVVQRDFSGDVFGTFTLRYRYDCP